MAGSKERIVRWRAFILRWTKRTVFVGYIVVSLAIMVPFFVNQHLRFQYLEIVSHWHSKVGHTRYVFIGDSLTAGGRSWGMRLDRNPFASRNLAGNGYTIRQITAQAQLARNYSPKFILVLAGTNDLLDSRRTASTQDILRDYSILLDECSKTNATVVVTLVPYLSNGSYKKPIDELNGGIRLLAEERKAKVIDLNPLIAPAGRLESEYTSDGTHLSESAYSIWCAEIRRTIGTD